MPSQSRWKRERKRPRGFTLIEVLIALLIISIALAGAIRATNESVRTTIHVRNTVAAHWVGLNVLSEIQTGLIELPSRGGTSDGKTKMLMQTWYWHVQTDVSTQLPKLTRITVTVRLKDHVVNRVVGYVG